MHPALGKPGPLSPSGTFPQPHHCTAGRLCRVPHRPSAGLCVWGAPGSAQLSPTLCWVLQGHEVPEPGPHSTRHRRQWHSPALHWHSDCSPVPAVPSPTALPCSHRPAEPLPQPTSAQGRDKAAGTRSPERARPAHPCSCSPAGPALIHSRRHSTSWEAPLPPLAGSGPQFPPGRRQTEHGICTAES